MQARQAWPARGSLGLEGTDILALNPKCCLFLVLQVLSAPFPLALT
jgi:hypothetical protein